MYRHEILHTLQLVEKHKPLNAVVEDYLEHYGWAKKDQFFMPTLEPLQRRTTYLCTQSLANGVRVDFYTKDNILPGFKAMQFGDVNYGFLGHHLERDGLYGKLPNLLAFANGVSVLAARCDGTQREMERLFNLIGR